MDSKNISAKNIGCMIALMAITSLLISGAFGSIGQDTWLAVVASIIVTIPLAAIYSRIATLNRGLGLYDIAYRQLGKAIGLLVTILLSLYAIHISALVAWNFSEYITKLSLEKTPRIILVAGMIAVAAYLASTDFKVIGRWSLITLTAISIIWIITFLGSIPELDFSRLQPIMEHDISQIISTGFSFATIAFFETMLALVAFGSLNRNDNPKKAYIIGIGYGALFLFASILRNVVVLGKEMIIATTLPPYVMARIVNSGTFLEHTESIMAYSLILLGITKCAICIRAASMGLSKIMRRELNIKRLIIPVSVVATAVCILSFANMQQFLSYISTYWLYAIPFTVIIPLVIWIKSEITYLKQRLHTREE